MNYGLLWSNELIHIYMFVCMYINNENNNKFLYFTN